MAIRIIDEKPDPKVVRRTICENCGVKLEYLPCDIKNRIVSDYGGGSDTYYWIDCPKCKKEIGVSNSIINRSNFELYDDQDPKSRYV